MEREYFAHHIYMIKILRLEHLRASKQPEVLGGLVEVFKGRHKTCRKDVHQALRRLQDSATKSSGACQIRGSGLLIGIKCSGVKDSAWMYLTSSVTTRIGVELVEVQGNYPTGL